MTLTMGDLSKKAGCSWACISLATERQAIRISVVSRTTHVTGCGGWLVRGSSPRGHDSPPDQLSTPPSRLRMCLSNFLTHKNTPGLTDACFYGIESLRSIEILGGFALKKWGYGVRGRDFHG